ncbi:MAG: hypothetical protein ACXWC9_05530 [Pseudobdellovibrionaceae bacterium]
MKNILLVSLSLSSVVCLSAQAVDVKRDYKFCREAIEKIARGNPETHGRPDPRDRSFGYKIPFDFAKNSDAMANGKESPTVNPKIFERSIEVLGGMPEKVTLKTTMKEGILAQYEIQHLDECERSMMGMGEPKCRLKRLVFNVDVDPVTNVCYFKDITYSENDGTVVNRPIMNEAICKNFMNYPKRGLADDFLSDPENEKGKWMTRFKLPFRDTKKGLMKPGQLIGQLDANCTAYVEIYNRRGGNSGSTTTVPVKKESAK